MLKAETKLVAKVSTACDAVDRDQRRLVDLTARQIRASSAMARQRDHPGEKVDRSQRGEAARQALQDARDLVEATRVQQAEALLGLVHESVQVGEELKRVDDALEQEICQEERAQLELSEAEAQASGRPGCVAAAHLAAERLASAAAKRASSAGSPRRRTAAASSSAASTC